MVAAGEHGTIRAYWRGCHCVKCRAAKAAWMLAWRRRRRPDHGFVSAEPLKAVLANWADRGLGLQQMSSCCGVSEEWLRRIRDGRLTRVRAGTARRILEAKPRRAHGVTVSAWRTRKLIKALLAEEYTVERIALALGRPSRGVTFGERVRIQTQAKVEALYRKWVGEDEEP